MKGTMPSAVALALSIAASGAVAWSSPQAPAETGGVSGPGWTIEIDLAPRPGPARGQYRLVAAIRDAGGGRLETVTLEVAPGQDARSERAVPGGGTFVVEVSVDGGARGASWSAEVRREGRTVFGQRARVRLDD